MPLSPRETAIEVRIANFENVILGRQKVREMMQEMGFSLLDQTRVVTAVSELARNIVIHAGSGVMRLRTVKKTDTAGIECVFEDQGPGIADAERALQKGFSTSNSLGLGLGGAKNLCREFDLRSRVGKGTKVTIREWLKK